MIPFNRAADWRAYRISRRSSARAGTACAGNVLPRLRHAVERGLRAEFPQPQGDLLAAAVSDLKHRTIDAKQLRRLRDLDSAATMDALFSGTVNGATMGLIRFAMVNSAMLGDMDAVVQWASAGLTRCVQLGGKWPATAPEWQWVISHRGYYVELIQSLGQFLDPK